MPKHMHKMPDGSMMPGKTHKAKKTAMIVKAKPKKKVGKK